MPVLHADSKKCYFLQGKTEFKSGWWLDVNTNPDIFVMDKARNAQKISFHTDTDELSIKLKPGQTFDFLVILNDKDSCYNRIDFPKQNDIYSQLNPTQHDTIPFVLSPENKIHLEVVLNEIDTLTVYFHTGSTGLELTHTAIKTRTSLLEALQADYQTSNFEFFPAINQLQLGNLNWKNLSVMAIPIRASGTDGSLGWNLFDGKVVEIDYDKSLLIIHTQLPSVKGYSCLNLSFPNHNLAIQADLIFGNRKFSSPFLLNSGYQRALLLDSVIRFEQNFPSDLEILKSTSLVNGNGDVFNTLIVNTNEIQLKNLKLTDVPAQLLDTDNPSGLKVHILGNELLKRFNTIYDFQKNRVYIKPNSLKDLEYIDGIPLE